MTFEESQEYKILKILYGNPRHILLDELELRLNDEIIDGMYITLNRMVKNGLLDEGIYSIGNFSDGIKSQGYRITILGQTKFNYLKKQKSSDGLLIFLYWGIFLATLISAVAILKLWRYFD